MGRKKKTETKPTEVQGPKEIKPAQIDFRDGRIILSLGDKEFFLKRNDVLRLISEHPGVEHLRDKDLTPEDDFSDLNTTENVAKLIVLANRKKLSGPTVAEKMAIPYGRFQKWLNDRWAMAERKRLMGSYKETILKAADAYDKATFPEDHRPRPKLKEFDVKKVAKLFSENNDLDYVASKLKVDRAQFVTWLQLHTKEVSKYMQMTADNLRINAFLEEMEKKDYRRLAIHT